MRPEQECAAYLSSFSSSMEEKGEDIYVESNEVSIASSAWRLPESRHTSGPCRVHIIRTILWLASSTMNRRTTCLKKNEKTQEEGPQSSILYRKEFGESSGFPSPHTKVYP